MKAVAKTNGTIPQWYRQIHNNLQTQQSEIFALTGDVGGYPVVNTRPTEELLHIYIRERRTLKLRRGQINVENKSRVAWQSHSLRIPTTVTLVHHRIYSQNKLCLANYHRDL